VNRVVEKIRRLLALGASTNAHEAAAAMAAAQRLCEEHRLELAEIETSRGPSEKAGIDDTPVVSAGKLNAWQTKLLALLATANGCVALRCRRIAKPSFRLVQAMLLAGRPSNVAMTRQLYAFAEQELIRLCKHDCKGLGKAFHRSWMIGAVDGVDIQLRRAQATARVGATITAITIVESLLDEANAALPKGTPYTKPTGAPTADLMAYTAGLRAGKSIQLQRPPDQLPLDLK